LRHLLLKALLFGQKGYPNFLSAEMILYCGLPRLCLSLSRDLPWPGKILTENQFAGFLGFAE
jgi:hypothetical protein